MAKTFNLKDKAFTDACEEVARYYTAGMDSAYRHAIKGDCDAYYERTASNRTDSWRRGYCFARNMAAGERCDLSTFARGMFNGMSIHDAETKAVMEFIGVWQDVTEAECERSVRDIAKDSLNSLGVSFSETSLCLWFDMVDEKIEELRELGARYSRKRDKWYLRCPV